jgi:uncharacterized membrane protein
MDSYDRDPVARRFERLMALTAYGLLAVSVFTLWLPALIAAAIAFAYRRDSGTLTASHFRYQLMVFWVSLILVALALAAFVGAGGYVLGALWSMLAASGDDWGWTWQDGLAGVGVAAGATAGLLTLAGLLLWGLSAVWTLAAAVWGALRLVSDRPMGQSPPVRDLELR